MILLVDFLLGLWLTLHAERAIAAYLTPQVPALGFAALALGFLPAEPKEAFGAWVSETLARPFVFRLAIAVGLLGLGVSLTVSTVIVESVEPGVATTFRVVRGTADRVDSVRWRVTPELRLNRLTSPQRRHLWTSPFGSRVWIHTERRVSSVDPRVFPWVSTRLQYPDDFDEMVTIEVLPTDDALTKLGHDDIVLEIRSDDGFGEPIASAVLTEGSLRAAFTEPRPLDSATTDAWRALLEPISADEEFVGPMLDAWAKTVWIRAGRPLRIGENVRYSVEMTGDGALAEGELLVEGELRLNDATTRLLLSF